MYPPRPTPKLPDDEPSPSPLMTREDRKALADMLLITAAIVVVIAIVGFYRA